MVVFEEPRFLSGKLVGEISATVVDIKMPSVFVSSSSTLSELSPPNLTLLNVTHGSVGDCLELLPSSTIRPSVCCALFSVLLVCLSIGL